MIKAQVLLSWEKTAEGNEPVIAVQPNDSAMDVTGQQSLIPSPNIVVWELWVEDIVPYEADSNIEILWWEKIIEEED